MNNLFRLLFKHGKNILDAKDLESYYSLSIAGLSVVFVRAMFLAFFLFIGNSFFVCYSLLSMVVVMNLLRLNSKGRRERELCGVLISVEIIFQHVNIGQTIVRDHEFFALGQKSGHITDSRADFNNAVPAAL